MNNKGKVIMKKNKVYCSENDCFQPIKDNIYDYDDYFYDEEDDNDERVNRDRQRRVNRQKKQYDQRHNWEAD